MRIFFGLALAAAIAAVALIAVGAQPMPETPRQIGASIGGGFAFFLAGLIVAAFVRWRSQNNQSALTAGTVAILIFAVLAFFGSTLPRI